MVSAVILHFHREHLLPSMLERLAELPVDEIIVVDNGSAAGLGSIVASHGEVRVLEPGENVGIKGRNLAARAARGDILLMLDDDAYPLPGAVETALAAFHQDPRLGVVGGLVRDVNEHGQIVNVDSLGSFDWFLRAGQRGQPPPTGFPAFFFPEGASFFRREAFIGAGGYLEPFVAQSVEVELATRLIGAGWDVRYLPTAIFDHRAVKPAGQRLRRVLYHRVRNQVWYFWLRFPAGLAARRIPAYLAFDFIECAYRGEIGTWGRAITDAWRLRATVRAFRSPLPRETLRRAELTRGRMHVQLLGGKLLEKLGLSA